jgi:hypothetical protein
MLGRVGLIALQLAGAWFGAPYLLKYMSLGGNVQVFLHGAVFAVLTWVVGLLGSQVLKGAKLPSVVALVYALTGGLVGAVLIVLKVPAMLPFPFPPLLLPLAMAILGYALKT